jgi:hypothetical protein
MADAFLPGTAPIAAVTGDPQPEAETAGIRRPPRDAGRTGPKRQRRMAPGGYFVLAMQSRPQAGGGK